MNEPDFQADSVWVVDRIVDGRVAILQGEEGAVREVPITRLPKGVAEGDAIRWVEIAGDRRFRRDDGATARFRHEAEALRRSIRRGPKGPLKL